MTSYDVSWFAQPSFPILVITFCFVQLSDVFGCKKGIAKQMEVLPTIGELSTLTILRVLHSCRSFYVILVNLSIWSRCRADIFGEICALEDENKLSMILTSLDFGYILYTYLSIKNAKKKAGNNNNNNNWVIYTLNEDKSDFGLVCWLSCWPAPAFLKWCFYCTEACSNFCVCGWNPKEWSFNWKLLSSAFLWCCLSCLSMWF